MGASRRLDAVHRVLERALKAGSLRTAARLFEEVDPEWFMDLEHVERLYRLVAFQHDMLRRGALEALRVGDYVVVKPNPRSPLVKEEYYVVEEFILDAVRGAASVRNYYYDDFELEPLVAPEGDEDPYIAESSLAGVTLLYTATRGEWSMLALNTFIAAVIGVDSDTGLLFAETLPRGTGLAALLLDKELREGDVRAVRAIMGYDSEASDWRGQPDSVVRLQGDLYVRVDAYTEEPRELARRVAAVWSAAAYAVRSFERLAAEAQRLYLEELSYLGGVGGLYGEFAAAARALKKALAKTYPWALEGIDCVLAGRCGSEEEGDAEASFEVYDVDLYGMPEAGVNTKPRLPDIIRSRLAVSEGNALIAIFERLDSLKVKTSPAIGDALTRTTNPAWAAAATAIWSWLNVKVFDEWDDGLSEQELAAAYKGMVVGALPRPLAGAREIASIPSVIAYAAASRALRGRQAPEEVSSAVRAAGEASVIEAEVGDHRVTLEGHLLEGPAHDGVIATEAMADLLKLRYVLEDYMNFENPLLALRASRARRAREMRLLAAAMISRLFMAKERLLAAVASGGEIEASHPEHGTARLELPEPALVTVTSNPAVIYTIEWFPRGAVPSYLKDRIHEERDLLDEDDWGEEEDDEM